MFLKKDWFLSRFIIYTIVLCLFYFTQCPQTRMFCSSLSSSSSFFLRTDKNQLLLPQSEEKKAVESPSQSGTLNHTNSRRNSSLFSSQNFQNILDKTNDLPKYIHLCFITRFYCNALFLDNSERASGKALKSWLLKKWMSKSIFLLVVLQTSSINNYVEEGYQV